MANGRKDKQAQFAAAEQKSPLAKILLAVLVLGIAGAIGGYYLLGGGPSGIQTVQAVANEVRLDLNQVSDGQAHYFNYETPQGTTVTFFVIKSVDGVMRAAFDACDVCYHEKKGYRQEGDQMVCNNCGQKFRTDLINVVKGGCNPAPLKRKIEAGQLVINHDDILQGARYFGS